MVEHRDFQIPAGSVYMFSSGIEDRAALDANWRQAAESSGSEFVEVMQSKDGIALVGADGHQILSFTGRQRTDVIGYFAGTGESYIDITGMPYTIWAPLLRAATEAGSTFRVVYIEPADYRKSPTPTQGMQFDLSEGFDGIQPLPGFASLQARRGADWHLVAALGFEGDRFAYVINELEPADDQIHPIIGIPGFRPEFASNSFVANRGGLENLDVIPNVRFARANCPFDFFHTLRAIHDYVGGAPLRVAAIGTKPHGLGAALYALSNPATVQLIYDHPRRKAKRTNGLSRVCIYDVSTFSQSELFQQPIVQGP
ncbi:MULTISPECIES: hypothetical protein [unclassified Mycobacterium]|uniref:hypothetical protein n=1 Tax=unclassified Mycobacterium TaxID=2642494 RepID=UPI00114D44C6|nr:MULTISPECIES: hypothetical protein [unclassified Mycobacterium]